jgi:hypothetical protein
MQHGGVADEYHSRPELSARGGLLDFGIRTGAGAAPSGLPEVDAPDVVIILHERAEALSPNDIIAHVNSAFAIEVARKEDDDVGRLKRPPLRT